MATRTGRMVMDQKTGKIVEEMKEDQILLAIYDPKLDKPEDHKFEAVLRSNMKPQKINQIFNCNAAYLRDPFGNILWPKDWLSQTTPPTGIDRWFYIIHERLEPMPLDDLNDPKYDGKTVILISNVPKECEEQDLKQWLLYGISQDFDPLKKIEFDLKILDKKKDLLKHKINAIPSMALDESTQIQQAEIRKKLATNIEQHLERVEKETNMLQKKKKHIQVLLFNEPIVLKRMEKDHDRIQDDNTSLLKEITSQKVSEDKKRIETFNWIADFNARSSRGEQLATIALDKFDWNYICLVKTRPTPKACMDKELTVEDMDNEINMRAVRLNRLKHGQGQFVDTQVDPLKENFHVSFVHGMYQGDFYLGKKHGQGIEYTNCGIYQGQFNQDFRQGQGKMIYGKGTTYEGTFERPKRFYSYGKNQDQPYRHSLLNGEDYRQGIEQGNGILTFPDGAKYEGEMKDGKITGYGKYSSSTGVIEEGMFLEGTLHGFGKRILPNGFCQQGVFEYGLLEGEGKETTKHYDYNGFFENGMKNGHGKCRFYEKNKQQERQQKGFYHGFWYENTLNGRGDFYYRKDIDDKNANPSKDPSSKDPNPHKELKEEETLDKDFLDVYQPEEDHDFWYEGSFIQNHPKNKHRHLDLFKQDQFHLPFTTNGKNLLRMRYLTEKLPLMMKKYHQRQIKNSTRRFEREKDYKDQKENENLSLYFHLLDEFYEKWATNLQQFVEDTELNKEECMAIQKQRQIGKELQEKRQKFRQEKYDLSPRRRLLPFFEKYLERISLQEKNKLDQANASI